jgi:hypothetical protein
LDTVNIRYRLIQLSHVVMILWLPYSIVFPKGGWGWLFFLIGMAGIYARQAQKAGWLGHLSLAGMVLCVFLPALLGIRPSTGFAFLSGAFSPQILFIGLAQIICLMLYGIATLRAGVLPRSVGFLFLACILMVPLLGLPCAMFCIAVRLLSYRQSLTLSEVN